MLADPEGINQHLCGSGSLLHPLSRAGRLACSDASIFHGRLDASTSDLTGCHHSDFLPGGRILDDPNKTHSQWALWGGRNGAQRVTLETWSRMGM